MKGKTIISIVLAVLLTAGAVFYQRMTGPTYTKEVTFTFNDQNYQLTLPRSHSNNTTDCIIKLERKELTLSANLIYKKFPSDQAYDTLPFNREGDVLTVVVPSQPPAGKLQYYIQVYNGSLSTDVTKENPVVIRFKGNVPSHWLIVHIIFIFLAMLLSNFTGFLALFGNYKFRVFSMLTLFCLILGGLVFGPIVQKYAFGVYWSGVPFGFDLTDNKTLISFIFWIIAVIFNMKKERPGLTIIAAIVTIIIFSIPHSLFGSQLDHSTGQITTGWILSLPGQL